MKRRAKITLIKYSIILLAGIAYLFWVLLTDLRIPCVFNLIFKLKCPGCGVTRMIASVARLDFVSAFHFNPFLFITAPIILFIIAYSEFNYIRRASYDIGKASILIWIELVAALIFGVFRNF